MRYLFIIGLLVSLNVQAQKVIRTDRIYLNQSLELKKVFSGDTLVFLIQNKVSGTGMAISINSPSVKFDFSATDLGFFLNYTNGDTNTLDVRDGGVLLQWGANDGNVGIGTQTPSEKLHVVGTSVFTDTLTYDIPSAATGYVMTALDDDGNATWQDPNAYGEMGFGDSSRTIALTEDVFSVVTNSNKTLWSSYATTLHNVTYAGDSLVADSGGVFKIDLMLSLFGTTNTVIKLGIFVNGTLVLPTQQLELASSQIAQIDYMRLVPLNAGDVVKVVVTNATDNDAITVVSGTILINKIR